MMKRILYGLTCINVSLSEIRIYSSITYLTRSFLLDMPIQITEAEAKMLPNETEHYTVDGFEDDYMVGIGE